MNKRERELREKLDLIEYYNEEVTKIGGKYSKGVEKGAKMVLCPFHDDNRPSMSIYKGRDGLMRFHCFACGAGGGVVEVHRRLEYEIRGKKVSKEEVIEELSNKFKIKLMTLEESKEIEESVFSRVRSRLLGLGERRKGIGLQEYKKTNKRLIEYKIPKMQKISSYNKLDIEMYLELERMK